MTQDRNQPGKSAATSFRSIRRRSKPLSQVTALPDGIANIFNDTPDTDPPEPAPPAPAPTPAPAPDPTPAAEPATGPAHLEATTRKFGQVRMLLTPTECPASLVNALRDKAGKVGRFCDRALLFQAEYDGGESALMVCFSGVEDASRHRIEGAVADALMASGHEGHALGILFLDPGSKSLERIARLGLDLKG